MKKNKKSQKHKRVFGQTLLDILFLVIFVVGGPAIRLFQKGNALRPRKWFWMLLGTGGFALTIAGWVFVVMEEVAVIFAAWFINILMTFYSIYSNREFVIKYNVMVDSGYFEDRERMMEANRIRRDQTWTHEAEESMEKIMCTETRVKASRELCAEQERRELKPMEYTPEETCPSAEQKETVDENTSLVQTRKLDL